MARSRLYVVNRNFLRDETKKAEGVCAKCRRPFLWDVVFHHPLAFTAGHIIDAAEGGSDEIDNLEPQHWSCNTSAGGRLGNERKRRDRQPQTVTAQPTGTDPHSQQWP